MGAAETFGGYSIPVFGACETERRTVSREEPFVYPETSDEDGPGPAYRLAEFWERRFIRPKDYRTVNNGLGLASPDPDEGDKLMNEERQAYLAAERKRKIAYYYRVKKQREAGLRK